MLRQRGNRAAEAAVPSGPNGNGFPGETFTLAEAVEEQARAPRLLLQVRFRQGYVRPMRVARAARRR
jgi:hypothetical protein